MNALEIALSNANNNANIAVTRQIPLAPFRLSWFHFETTKPIDEIDAAIVNELSGRQYTNSPFVYAYIGNTFEIHIYKGYHDDTTSFIVDCHRIDGDEAFLNIDSFERIRRVLNCGPEDPERELPLPTEQYALQEEIPIEFRGKSLSDFEYDDLTLMFQEAQTKKMLEDDLMEQEYAETFEENNRLKAENKQLNTEIKRLEDEIKRHKDDKQRYFKELEYVRNVVRHLVHYGNH